MSNYNIFGTPRIFFHSWQSGFKFCNCSNQFWSILVNFDQCGLIDWFNVIQWSIWLLRSICDIIWRILINCNKIMDQFSINFYQLWSISISFWYFEEKFSGNSQFDFSTSIKYPCSRWFKINENQFDYSDQSVTHLINFQSISRPIMINFNQFLILIEGGSSSVLFYWK